MSLLAHHQSNLKRERDRAAREQNALAGIAEKISRKQGELRRAGTPSRTQSLGREIQRLLDQRAKAEQALAASQKKIGNLSEKVTRKEQREQHQAEQRQHKLARDQTRARASLERKVARTATQVDELDERVSGIEDALLDRVRHAVAADPVDRKFDVFLSHTDPDKELAAELYTELTARGLAVWFDGAELRLGESLTRQIDRGIAASRIGVILITEAFLKGRYWTEREMGALITSRRRVIPVLDGVDHRDLAEYSPLLADLVGLSTETAGFDEVAERIAVTLATADEER